MRSSNHGSPAGNATTSGRGMTAGALNGGFPAKRRQTMAKSASTTGTPGILKHTGLNGHGGPLSACDLG